MKKPEISEWLEASDLADSCEFEANDARTVDENDTRLTQPCSGFDPESTPESRGAMAALGAKAAAQSCPRFFDDPIDIRRNLIAKRQAAGANTPYGHTCSNIIEQLDRMFVYERQAWATDVRQTLPGAMNLQLQRLARLSGEQS